MDARAFRRARWGAAFLLAISAGLALAPLPLPPPPTAPLAQPGVVAAAAPAAVDRLTAAQRWPHETVRGPRRIDDALAAELQAALDRARTKFGTYGAEMAASWDASRAWTGASGVMRDGRAPLDADQPLVIGSVTKTFTATLILQLAEEGRVSLDASVTDYLPDVPQLDRRITLRELLAHTSGLADLYHPLAASLVAHPDRAWTPREVLERIGPRWFAPGAGWAYSNTNYVVLGMVAEAVTGEPAARLLEERFSGPLGLAATRLLSSDGGTLLDSSWATAFWTAGAISSTAADMVRWGDALYGGRLLDASSMQQMLSFNTDDYGLGARRMSFGTHEAIGHTGLLATYTTILMHFPAEGTTIALLVNRSEVDLPAMLSARVAGQPSLLDLVFGADAR